MAHEYPIQFGKYLLTERIAVGGMAEVFKALFRSIEGVEKVVAVKRILPEYSVDEDFVSLFIDEARISATLQHANIVQVFDFGKIDRNYYIAMEHVDGPNLKNFFRRVCRDQGSFSVEFAIYIIVQLLKALDYLYRARDASDRPLYVIHRDISPQNILLSREGEVKITDFGIAKAASKLSKTQPGKIQGKFGYMSPEQAIGKDLDHRSDLFSLGIIFYELLTGQKLYSGENTFIRFEKVKEANIEPVSKYREIDSELERIVMKMLAKDPDDRYQNTADLQKDLTDYLYPANIETIISSLANAVHSYFPKQDSMEREVIDEAIRKRDEESGSQNDDQAETQTHVPQTDSESHQGDSKDDDATQPKRKVTDKGLLVVEPQHRYSRRVLLNIMLILFVAALATYWTMSGMTVADLPFIGRSLVDQSTTPNQNEGGQSESNSKSSRPLAERFEEQLAANESLAQELRMEQDKNEQMRSDLNSVEQQFTALEIQFKSEQQRWERERKSLQAQLAALQSTLTEVERECPRDMAYVKAGRFFFGSAENDPERNLGEALASMVSIKGFCIDRYEFPNKIKAMPKVNISWEKAIQACEKAGKRLCSEREWERACKGPKGQRYTYGPSWVEKRCNTEDKLGRDQPLAPAGSYAACKNGFEVYDMSGNAAEWTDTSGGAIRGAPLVKGGAHDRPGYWSRCSARLDTPAEASRPSIGFRCCKDPRST